MKLSVLFLIFFSFTQITSQTTFSAYPIQSLEVITNLDTSLESRWYVTTEDLNPTSFTRNYLNTGENPVKWIEQKVPSVFDKRTQGKSEIKKIWMAKSLTFPNKINANSISVRLGVITDRDKTYFNGELIGSTGEFGSQNPTGYDRIRVYEIPERLIRPGDENLILIEVEEYFYEEMGISQDRTEIGPTQLIEKSFYNAEYIKLILLMMYFTVALYFLFLYIRRRKEQENLFFGVFTVMLVIYQFFRNQLKYELGVDFLTLKRMEYLIINTITTVFAHFIRTYFKFKWNLAMKIVDGIIASIFFYCLVSTNVRIFNILNINIVQPLWLFYISLIIYFLIKKIREENKDAMLILGGMIFIVIGTVMDSLSNRQIIVLPRVLGYLFVFFIMSLAVILANRFVRLNEEIEDLNEGLEKKVAQRTEELSTSLEEVRKLKVAQDGDYFLTSLLIQPLGRNRAEKNQVIVDFILRQKKTFEFRKKASDLGGDLCRSETITLRDRKMTVFFNADAMGKSMQGAGGAIVVGSVFDSILERTSLNEEVKNLYPERWLKNSFVELHKVFESFHGSMLVSIVMGIIDNYTGVMYYINAEHPFSVLYRDGKASFLGEGDSFCKLGAEIAQGFIYVNMFQLQHNDIIINGSDGRDDLIMLNPATGKKEMNYDHTLFLKRVEKCGADLNKILESLYESGEVTDDISLLSVKFEGGNPEYDKNLVHEEVKEFVKKKNYLPALEKLEKYLELNPSDTEAVFMQSFVLKKMKKFNESIISGERVRIREPKNYRNLVNLAHSYYRIKNIERAKYLAGLVPDGKEKDFVKIFLME